VARGMSRTVPNTAKCSGRVESYRRCINRRYREEHKLWKCGKAGVGEDIAGKYEKLDIGDGECRRASKSIVISCDHFRYFLQARDECCRCLPDRERAGGST
jgi:hypothetical protein